MPRDPANKVDWLETTARGPADITSLQSRKSRMLGAQSGRGFRMAGSPHCAPFGSRYQHGGAKIARRRRDSAKDGLPCLALSQIMLNYRGRQSATAICTLSASRRHLDCIHNDCGEMAAGGCVLDAGHDDSLRSRPIHACSGRGQVDAISRSRCVSKLARNRRRAPCGSRFRQTRREVRLDVWRDRLGPSELSWRMLAWSIPFGNCFPRHRADLRRRYAISTRQRSQSATIHGAAAA